MADWVPGRLCEFQPNDQSNRLDRGGPKVAYQPPRGGLPLEPWQWLGVGYPAATVRPRAQVRRASMASAMVWLRGTVRRIAPATAAVLISGA